MRDDEPVVDVETIVRDGEDEVVQGVEVCDEEGGFCFFLAVSAGVSSADEEKSAIAQMRGTH